jgi:hypothetical protein
MPVQLNNVAARNKKLQQPVFEGIIPQTPDYFIRAQVKNMRPVTVLEFHPNKLPQVLEKYPDGLVYQKNGPKL